MSRPAAGGGRWVEVAPERLERWLDGFAERHGPPTWAPGDRPGVVVLLGPDGPLAEVHLPFDPGGPVRDRAGLVAEAHRHRRVGLVLVRRGGHAVGVLDGSVLAGSKSGSRHVQGRTAAGGWSQQRYARRREAQVRAACAAAADAVAAVLLPEAVRLEAVVTGGDRAMLLAVLADPRLVAVRPLVVGRVLEVPEPRRAVLDRAAAQARAVRIRLLDPPAGSP